MLLEVAIAVVIAVIIAVGMEVVLEVVLEVVMEVEAVPGMLFDKVQRSSGRCKCAVFCKEDARERENEAINF